MSAVAARHDGHKHKDEGYYSRNNLIARSTFWIVAVAVIVGIGVYRIVRWNSQRQKTKRFRFSSLSTRPKHATMRVLAAFRWLSYPRHTISSRFPSRSRGEIMFAIAYLAFTWALLFTNVLFPSSTPEFRTEWEVVGFRAAWVATTQLPLLYCTGGQIEPIKAITGISDDTIKQFHALIGVNVFITLIVHWASFFHIWDVYQSIMHNIREKPMITWGFIAWSVFGLSVILSLTSRTRWYEPWLISHVVLGYAALLLSYLHTGCTMYFVLAAICFILINRIGKLLVFSKANLHLAPTTSPGNPMLGYNANLEVLDSQYLQLRINNPSFTWQAGQHIYLHAPEIRTIESHPFTISNISSPDTADRSMLLVIKEQNGFTKSLFESLRKLGSSSLHVTIMGPFGNPPQLKNDDRDVFIASGNRVSFILPLVKQICMDAGGAKSIVAHLIVVNKAMLTAYASEILDCCTLAGQQDLDVSFIIHLTQVGSVPQAREAHHNMNGRLKEMFVLDDEDSKDDFASHAGSPIDEHLGESSTLLANQEAEVLEMQNLQANNGVPALSIDTNTAESTEKLHSDSAYHSDDDSEHKEQLLMQGSQPVSALFSSPRVQIRYGRPSAESMIEPTITTCTSEDSVKVVVAVGEGLLNAISDHVSQVSKAIAFEHKKESDHSQLPRSIKLWHESGGS